MAVRHFLTLNDLSSVEIENVIHRAIEMKAAHRDGTEKPLFANKVLGMFFAKASTRTRVSFEAGMTHLGGSAIFLSSTDTQLGRGEPIEDTARVLSRYVDMVMIRTYEHADVEKFAEYSSVPVINGLTNDYHPCQLLADLMTFVEHRGPIQGKKVAWIGDGFNMCNSWINAAILMDFELAIACPPGYEPDPNLVASANGRVTVTHSPSEAVRDAHLVTTDVFASMGHEEEWNTRAKDFADFQVNHALLKDAASDVLFMHCLPAYRGYEVTDELLEDESISVVWDEAENRLHAQKALMAFLMGV